MYAHTCRCEHTDTSPVCSSTNVTVIYITHPRSFIIIISRWGTTKQAAGEVTHLRSKGIIFLCAAVCCQASVLDGKVAVATEDGKRRGWGLHGGWGDTASADARRQIALPERHERCWSLRQLSPSPPPTLPPLLLPSVKRARRRTWTQAHMHARTLTHT